MDQQTGISFARKPDMLHRMLATAFEERGGICDHSSCRACSDCLANLALDTIQGYVRDVEGHTASSDLTPNARAVLRAHILG